MMDKNKELVTVVRNILVSELQEIYFEEGNDNFELVYTSSWEQDGKSQYQQAIYKAKDDGKYYSVWISRSGSPFSDWYYDQFEYVKEGAMEEMTEVVRVEKVIVGWETVKIVDPT